jgi:hypothetical protein
MSDEPLIKVPVRNKELLETLNRYPELRHDEDFEKYVRLVYESERSRDQGDYYTGEEYRKEIVNQGTAHEGFPDYILSYNFKINSMEHQIFTDTAPPVWRNEFTKKLVELNDKMMNFLATRNNALTVIYPPGGYISWHNNANAHGFNLIFTWSETGDGWFKYVDPNTRKVVTVQDQPGWQCKAAYFGSYREPEKLMYHAAKTNCWRCTISYIFNETEIAKEFREEILEDIRS